MIQQTKLIQFIKELFKTKTKRMLTKVIDLSHWNDQVNWDKVKSAQVDGVYLKCTQGLRYIDPMCAKHAVNSKGHSISVGYYHFATLTDDAAAEAKFFHDQLMKLPKSDLLPILDIEENKAGFTSTQVEAWIHLFNDTMNVLNTPIGIYSYTPFLDQFLPNTHQFGQLPLWIAQYRNVTSPSIPHGWTTAALWQYTNLGTVDGIHGTVDMSKPITQALLINQ